jgi:hypothetical protein
MLDAILHVSLAAFHEKMAEKCGLASPISGRHPGQSDALKAFFVLFRHHIGANGPVSEACASAKTALISLL